MASPSCSICGKKAVLKTNVDLNNPRERNYVNVALNPTGEISLCTKCFDLLARCNYDALEENIPEKLRGENNATSNT